MISIISSVDANMGIGYKNRLLYNIPDDLHRFKKLTTGNVVVMGRKTLESLPNHSPLKNRQNIILTRNTSYVRTDCLVLHNAEQVLSFSQQSEREVFIIGGSEIYSQFINIADKLYLTEILENRIADCYFPEYKNMFTLLYSSELKEYENIKYKFCVYKSKE